MSDKVTPPAPGGSAAAPAAPASPPASATPSPVVQSFDTSFPDDGLDTPTIPAAPAKPAAPDQPPTPKPDKTAAASPSTTKPDAPAPDPNAAPADDDDGSGDDTADYNPPNVAKPSELRAFASRVGKRLQKAHSELAQLRNEVTRLKSAPPGGEDTAAMTQELTALKKQVEEYESTTRLNRYENSQEYATKFKKPWQDAYARAFREVKELIVSSPNPNDPEAPPVERLGTEDDFNEIYQAPLGQATRLAKQKFGDAAMIVLQHRQQIRQLAEQAYAAVQEYKTKGAEAEKAQQAQTVAQQEGLQRMFYAAVEGHAKRQSDLFSERDGDTDGNELLAKGKQFAAAVFAGNDGLTPQQVAFRDGLAFNRLSAYPRLVRDVKSLQAQLAEANQTIEQLRGSGPGKPQPGAASPVTGSPKSLDEAFDEAVPA